MQYPLDCPNCESCMIIFPVIHREGEDYTIKFKCLHCGATISYDLWEILEDSGGEA